MNRENGQLNETQDGATSPHKKKHSMKIHPLFVVISVTITLILLWYATPSMRERTLRYFMKIMPTVAIATFLGSLLEIRNWIRWMKRVLKPLVIFGRLPHLSGVTMVLALFSNKSASALLSGALSDGTISRPALRTTAMCNSYLAYISHSLRIAYPTIAALGIAGIYYFTTQFILGFCIILFALIIHRAQIDKACEVKHTFSTEKEKPLPTWKATFKRAGKRTLLLLLRLVLISVPSYLVVLILAKMGVFKLWQEMMPGWMAAFFPAEVMAVTVAMLGGIVNAATIGGEFLQGGQLTNVQILFAMLVGSAMGNPVRTIRRNLPSAMGIFNPKDGLFIVGTMQSARFITVILVCITLALFMRM